MVRRYHLNKATGEVGPCRAEKVPCPLGPLGEHFLSASEAHKALERRAELSGSLFAAFKKSPLKKEALKSPGDTSKNPSQATLFFSGSEGTLEELEEGLKVLGKLPLRKEVAYLHLKGEVLRKKVEEELQGVTLLLEEHFLKASAPGPLGETTLQMRVRLEEHSRRYAALAIERNHLLRKRLEGTVAFGGLPLSLSFVEEGEDAASTRRALSPGEDIHEALELFQVLAPRAWLEFSNSRKLPLRLKREPREPGSGRLGAYNSRTGILSYVDQDYPTKEERVVRLAEHLLHEFTHRIEHEDTRMRALAEDAYVARTSEEGSKQDQIVLSSDDKFLTRIDKFADEYAGATYVEIVDRKPKESAKKMGSELSAVGIQGTLLGRRENLNPRRAKDEMLNAFALGLLTRKLED